MHKTKNKQKKQSEVWTVAMAMRPNNDALYQLSNNFGRYAQSLGLSLDTGPLPEYKTTSCPERGMSCISPVEGRSPTSQHSGQHSPGPPAPPFLCPCSRPETVATRTSPAGSQGFPGRRSGTQRPVQGQEENEPPRPKKTVLLRNKLLWPRYRNLFTQTQPHLLPRASEGALQNCLQHTDPLRRPIAHSIWRR